MLRDSTKPPQRLFQKSGASVDLALTLPIFLVYHLGVVFLPVRNAADLLTGQLKTLSNHSLPLYAGLTLALGAMLVVGLLTFGARDAFSRSRFVAIGLEGAVYAVLMRAAGSYMVGALHLARSAVPLGAIAGIVMSLGAGLYEEIAFRAGLFGLGALTIKRLALNKYKATVLTFAWAFVAAAVFSGWHYVGKLGDPVDPASFAFRMFCGLALTLIYAARGFAPAVWTHALYDAWVMLG